MKIGLFGFGKTGKAVANVILQHEGFTLEWVYRQSNILEGRSVPEFLGVQSDDPGTIYSSQSISVEDLLRAQPVDMVIDFSSETGLSVYGEAVADAGIKIISAVSHYGESQKAMLQKLAQRTVVFWSPNITLGVNYLLFAAQFLKKIAPWVDIEINEEHFKEKKGTSGTAVKLAQALELTENNINSVRAGGIVGKHEVIFGFPYQTVRLIHESISREAFGSGVIFVAENLKTDQPGLYKFEDILLPYFSPQQVIQE